MDIEKYEAAIVLILIYLPAFRLQTKLSPPCQSEEISFPYEAIWPKEHWAKAENL